VQLVKVERQNAELRRDLRQLRADSARASADHRTTVSRLEESLAEERGVSEGLRCEVVDLQRQNQSLVSRAERRFSELEQELAAAHGETAMAKEEGRAVRTKLNEAELAHRALKEGGARLQRELAERDRRIGQFEKGKGKRWNMI
jgi:chromosome segregation ATPase